MVVVGVAMTNPISESGGKVDSHHYVPILLTKRGERSALRDLPYSFSSQMTPILVVAPIDWNFDEERPSKSLTDHLARLPNELYLARGNLESFIDLPFLDDDDEFLANGQHALHWLTEETQTPLIPTVSITRSAAYVEAVKDVIDRDKRGACLRLPVDEWPSVAAVDVERLASAIGCDLTQIDLVLDLGEESGALALTASRQEMVGLPNKHEWRSVVIAATGMPKQIPQGKGIHEIERGEWTNYLAIRGQDLERVPTFGDYVIANPDPILDVDPKWLNLSASVRYTVSESWIVPKGDLFKGNSGRSQGAAAVPPVLQLLRAQPSYAGPDHCGLEQWVSSVLDDGGNSGNAETWRRYGTLHHLQFVIEQLATLRGT